MARKKKTESKRPIESYEHRDKERVNNPPVGLVTPQTDPDAGQKKKTYAYDPHLDPQLVWAGKAEHTSFEVPTVSLHVHERIDPRTIIEAVKRRNGSGGKPQMTLFDTERQEPLRQAVEFYQHAHGWSNRMVAGDSLLVMNSLLEKEGMAGKVQMIYIDPPYGIKYGSNFQPFVNKRDVKDGKDEDLTAEPEQIRAFRDTWELGIHSYLTYLRDRLLLARELLTESGSIFVQISDENVHRVRCLMDEVFGTENFVAQITFTKTSGATSELIPCTSDYLIWYSKDRRTIKFRRLLKEKVLKEIESAHYQSVELISGERRALTKKEMQDLSLLPNESRVFAQSGTSSQTRGKSEPPSFVFCGKPFKPETTRSWSTNLNGLQRLAYSNRLHIMGQILRFVRYLDDAPMFPLSNLWADTAGIQSRSDPKVYVVQTANNIIQRCLLMTTDPGDLVFDPTCGSGTTAYVVHQTFVHLIISCGRLTVRASKPPLL